MLIIESQSMNIYRNLAIEEYLMEHAVDQGPVLFLWQSDCAVVMGKNQNPWRECRLDLMRDEGIPLARRISGGGTVYHDTGNLNYCVMVDRREYREQKAYDMVLRALKSFGIRAGKTGTSNLSLNGLKFSGNAFCFRKSRALHHGTLLLRSDLEKLKRYLGAMIEGIETHAIASVPVGVMNLDLDIKELSQALKDCFRHLYCDSTEPARLEIDDLDAKVMERLMERQQSDDWKYGVTPRFQMNIGATRLEVSKGIVVQADGPLRSTVEGKPFAEIMISSLC